MSKDGIICPRCKEFLGEVGNLDECPICGYDFENEDEQ